MQVKFVQTTRARLDSLAVTNGQLIYLKDEDAAYYDLSDVRHSLLGVKFVTSLPSTGLANVLYVVTNSTDKTAYIWDSSTSAFVNVGGLYTAGSGLTLNASTNEFKADLLSDTKLTADAVAAAETANRIYPIVLDHSGHLAVNVPWVEYTVDNTPANGSTNLVTSGGVYTSLQGKQDTLTIDATPTSGSTHVVQSGGVYTALDGKMDDIPVDSTPASGSTNLVTSGGVYDAISAVPDELDDLTDVDLGTLTDGQILKYDATSDKWINGDASATIDELGDIDDVDLTSLADGQIIKWDATNSKWVNASLPTVPDELNDLSDVDLTSPVDGQILKYDGTSWVNATPSEGLELGETSSTAYRGDRGKEAYDHASDSAKITTAEASGLYKVASTADGHIASLTAVVKQDIVDLGIPAQDTTYAVETAASGSTVESLVTAGEKYTWDNKADAIPVDSTPASGSTNLVESGGVYTAIDGKMDDIPVDSAPASGSTNLVESGGVYTALADKQDTLEWDTAPASGSTKAIDSGAVYTALSGKMDDTPIDSTPASGSTNLVTSGAVYTALSDKVDTSDVGAANGVAELDATGKVPSSQLPSYVDDVVEGYYNTTDGKFYEEATYTTEIVGEASKIYLDLSTNTCYRWGGSAFVQIAGGLTLGETSTTAYRGDRGKTAYDHATDSARLTSAKSEALYKIGTTAEGHVASATTVSKSDITDLGIPAQDTTYSAGNGISIDSNDKISANIDADTIVSDVSTGTLSVSSEFKKVFKGTKAEWIALSAAEKSKYPLVALTDDADYVGNIVDTVADGNMSAVTSNAVYDYIDTMITQALNAGY